ncbi:MAG: NAD(+) synthetase [Parcubacteria group bacterium CG11_big_fil_rev_8_21_14_0_20_39_14]|nr:MAG: NAD(+) synthetase [Parcubacteria group bacterium CG11_big_fil_rev_8_21_14_0_20_39_14]PIS35610.1 MAG: NAD(+) synthetase [Parcubacteria group bacterium CG08_land_8_20_14_0_20_38_56]
MRILQPLPPLEVPTQKTIERIVRFLKREFKKRKKTRAILGISGGLDSAVTAIFCKKAGLDLYPVLLPYGKHFSRDLSDAKKLLKFLKIDKKKIIKIDISPLVNFQIKSIGRKIKLDKIARGNIIARQRMIILYALSNQLGGLVVGTGNLSEYLLGYFTLHGDGAWDINPLARLFKTQIFELAKFLGVPKEIISKKSTAGLWPGQTDEGELGFSYQDADPILYFSIIKKIPKEKLARIYHLNKNLMEKVLKRVKETEYKRQAIKTIDKQHTRSHK